MATLLLSATTHRTEQLLKEWEFRRDHTVEATEGWKQVRIPHDWAIYGPFSREYDLQTVAVVQNGETVATEKTGRTGGLPYMGKGAYRKSLTIEKADDARYILLFDGAMSEAQVFVNDQKVGFWPYGYNSFWCDATDAVVKGENRLHVLLENKPQSSRWYPGAGLYRKVRLVVVPKIHVPVWGTQITTPYVGEEYASVTIKTELVGVPEKSPVTLRTLIRNAEGGVVAEKCDTRNLYYGMPFEQHLTIPEPKLWSPETPNLYTAETTVIYDGKPVDCYTTRFGVRTIELRADKGFFLNGQLRKFKGVCLHHDLGPLGAAINKAAIRRQLTILKDMGCDAIRTSHNMPAEELVELCDEMGFMMQLEPFDEWDVAKCENGYHRFFDEWAERDMVNMLRHYRNNASVVMWSVGNEVPTQWNEGGYKVASWLQSICHREDSTRPVTCGMDQFPRVLQNGFAAQFDVAGFNYRVHFYEEGYKTLPQNLILGSETTSTVSSRGVYHFPAEEQKGALHEDHHSSSYDLECCWWSNLPDLDMAANDDFDWLIGQFVWTGFDYLGEPTPYDTDAWPNHSSMFGIVDLASIPKDRYWLYRSIWNTEEETLHILPHWNWKGR
ncbi:MAG: beta-galactosidase, partial [Alistipes sp.]|nr:beta-galactosidase [Alistipes sp.]